MNIGLPPAEWIEAQTNDKEVARCADLSIRISGYTMFCKWVKENAGTNWTVTMVRDCGLTWQENLSSDEKKFWNDISWTFNSKVRLILYEEKEKLRQN